MFAKPWRSRLLFAALFVVGAVTFGLAAAGETSQSKKKPFADEQQVMAVLDEFMETFNRRDRDAHLKTYLFPHVRLAAGKVQVLAKAEELPTDLFGRGLPADFDHSEWLSREIVQSSPDKVHVATEFRRLRQDGSTIADYESLYVLEKVGDRWGIRARSSFAP